jgi:hypothetical protein
MPLATCAFILFVINNEGNGIRSSSGNAYIIMEQNKTDRQQQQQAAKLVDNVLLVLTIRYDWQCLLLLLQLRTVEVQLSPADGDTT